MFFEAPRDVGQVIPLFGIIVNRKRRKMMPVQDKAPACKHHLSGHSEPEDLDCTVSPTHHVSGSPVPGDAGCTVRLMDLWSYKEEDARPKTCNPYRRVVPTSLRCICRYILIDICSRREYDPWLRQRHQAMIHLCRR